MNTALLLMAQFGPRAAIPLEDVRREYFPHLAMEKLLNKIARGDIPLPVTRVDRSQRGAKFVSMMDLAVYLDTEMEAGRKEYEQLKAAAGSGPDAKQRFVELMFARK
jgi:hypothetical protein